METRKIIRFSFFIILTALIVMALAMFYTRPIKSNYPATKAQIDFLTNEVNAISKSSPIDLKNVLVFGSGTNITQGICGQQQAYFVVFFDPYKIEYNGIYFPVSVTIGSLLQSSTYFANKNLLNQKVYLDFITNNSKNVSAPYILNKIYIKGNMSYWILGQYTGISNNTASLYSNNLTAIENSPSALNGVIFLNGTVLISPKNPDIENGNFTASNC